MRNYKRLADADADADADTDATYKSQSEKMLKDFGLILSFCWKTKAASFKIDEFVTDETYKLCQSHADN